MSDQVLTPDPAPVTVSAVAQSMTSVGFGLFALLQPGTLADIPSLPQVTERLAREEAARAAQHAQAQAAASAAAASAAASAAAIAVAAELSGLDADAPAPVSAAAVQQGAAEAVVPVAAQPVPEAPVAAPTLAMLKEISFLDE